MPELPEVETVVRMLARDLVGRRLVRADVGWKKTIGGGSVEDFERATHGARVARIWRRAKYLVFDLERGGKPAGHLLGHLRMSGRMQVASRDWDPGPHVRVSFDLDDGRRFHFIDPRKFGRLVFERDLERPFADLGGEPLEREFRHGDLYALLRARRRQLKPLLLDQSVIAGLGNIYVDESLHLAGLDPRQASTQVDQAAARRLHSAIRTTLRAAIRREGSSFDTFYRTPEGRPGSYQSRFRVYGREGKPCPVCKTPIVKFTLAQRGTHVCPVCQPKRRALRPAKRRPSARARARRGA